MRHSRPDYNRIQDPLGVIPEDEPVFLLRAQDAGAPLTVLAWSTAQEAAGASPEVVAQARQWAQVMSAYQAEHGMKLPDLPADEVVWPEPEDVVQRVEVTAPVGSRWRSRATGRVVEVASHSEEKAIGYATDHSDEPPFVITHTELLGGDWTRVNVPARWKASRASNEHQRANVETVTVSDPVWQAVVEVLDEWEGTTHRYRMAAMIVAVLHHEGHLTTTYPQTCPPSS